MIIIKVKVNIKQVMLGTAALAGMLVTSQAVANADSMTIKAGDTVWAYAQKYNVSVDKIAEANGLSNPNMIIAGKTINIPGVKTGEKVTAKKTAASASSAKSTSAATSTSSQAASSTTSASSTSQAVSSSSVAAQSSSTSTASASSVTSSASTSSVVSQASSSAVTSSATSQSSASQSSASQASQSSTSVASSTSTQSAATSTSSQASSTASNTTTNSSSTTTATATAYRASATTSSTASYSSVIAAGKTFIGTPYEQMDCSAFTQAAFAKVGRSIGRTTYAQATIGTHVSFSQAQAGDLIFWGSDSEPYHVGIYLGGGQYIASPTYGETVSIKSTAYYTPSFAIHM
ncbi:gamma-D-glutamate-meso-diaminopimelate muropeptidase [Lactiplantibacillus argentoratensis DSM 16365]|nr:gamma-D-glutamate-meso-diaminopimelate muropeptidase [Lactiplantibacillus argentoratensis DSM 16365]